MRTIQMTLDDELVTAVDKVVRRLKTSRSAFTRQALSAAIEQFYIRAKEQQHRQGYLKKPSNLDSWEDWEAEQEWGD